jgi:NADH dehydrogenase (ubiquinone) flavoprotein 2
VLFIAQKQNGNFLSLAAMRKVAQILEVPEMDVFEVSAFYTMYNREKVGKFHLQVCGTTPCQLCGSREIISAIEKRIGCHLGETSKDGMFTLSEVECLGACANAPMLQVNNEYVYEDLTPDNVVKLLDDLKAGTDKKGPQNNRKNAEGPMGKTTLLNPEVTNVKHDRDFAEAKKAW